MSKILIILAVALGVSAYADAPNTSVTGDCSQKCKWKNGESDKCRDSLQEKVDKCLGTAFNDCEIQLGGKFSYKSLPEIVLGNEIQTAIIVSSFTCEYTARPKAPTPQPVSPPMVNPAEQRQGTGLGNPTIDPSLFNK